MDVQDPADLNVRRIGSLCGIAGAIALAIYFGAPALLGWPFAGGSAAELAAYARSHEILFYAGAWLQGTGALLSTVFIRALLRLARATTTLPGLVTLVGTAVLLATVAIEAAFLVAVPIAAAAGDDATVQTAFAMSNGVFVRIFPLAPASATLIGLGMVLRGTHVLDRRFGWLALGLGVAFEVAGLAAVFSPVGLVLGIALSIGQDVWVVAAAIALGVPILKASGAAGMRTASVEAS